MFSRFKRYRRGRSVEVLYALFRVETRCLPRGFRPGEAKDVTAKDRLRFAGSKYQFDRYGPHAWKLHNGLFGQRLYLR